VSKRDDSKMAPICRHCFEKVNVQRKLDGSFVVLNPDGSVHSCDYGRMAVVPPVGQSVASSGEQLRDQGAAVVEAFEKAHTDWVQRANEALLFLARSGRDFNADDVRDIAGSPLRPNAMGALFLRAVRDKTVVQVGERKMVRPIGHARRTATYRGAAVGLTV
jgi:hypothetical protein